MRDKLSEDGKLVIALVLPFSGYVETGNSNNDLTGNGNTTGVINDSIGNRNMQVLVMIGETYKYHVGINDFTIVRM